MSYFFFVLQFLRLGQVRACCDAQGQVRRTGTSVCRERMTRLQRRTIGSCISSLAVWELHSISDINMLPGTGTAYSELQTIHVDNIYFEIIKLPCI